MGGTMRWQSPERLQGHDLTRQCDVYSFALVVYEVCVVDDVAESADLHR
jgi:serine/threonine protein kinase